MAAQTVASASGVSVHGSGWFAQWVEERLHLAQEDAAIVCWPAPVTSKFATGSEGLESALLDGLAATQEALESRGRFPQRIVHVVECTELSLWRHTYAASVGALTKALACEFAHAGTTVNAVGIEPRNEPTHDLRLIEFLGAERTGFVTGQTFGEIGARLAAPQDRPGAQLGNEGWVLVSGGGGASGLAIARELHAAGHQVLIGHRGSQVAEELASQLGRGDGPRCEAVPLDVASDTAGQISALIGRFDRISGLILCDDWNRAAQFAETSAADWLQTVQVNLTGPARVVEHLQLHQTGDLDAVVAVKPGSAGIGEAGGAVYAMARAGLAGFIGADLCRLLPSNARSDHVVRARRCNDYA